MGDTVTSNALSRRSQQLVGNPKAEAGRRPCDVNEDGPVERGAWMKAGTGVGGLIERPITSFALVLSAVAIASVPICYYQDQLSMLPRWLALAALFPGLLSAFEGLPPVHAAIACYLGLFVLWAPSALSRPDVTLAYLADVKVAILAVAVYAVCQNRLHILIIFGLYALTALPSLAVNFSELQNIHSDSGIAKTVDGLSRFAGTFQNANTAGLYGVTVVMGGLVVFVGARHWVRWAILLTSIIGGLTLIYFSGSRKAMLGVGIVAIAFPFLRPNPSRDTRVLIRRCLLLGAGAIFSAIFLWNLPHGERLFSVLSEGAWSEQSSSERLTMLYKAFELWFSSPVWGVGYDGFAADSGFGMYSHSTPAEILCNGGLLGVAFGGVFYLYPLFDLVRAVRLEANVEEGAILRALLLFWVTFCVFSAFAVLFNARDYIPMCAAICGFLRHRAQESFRRAGPSGMAAVQDLSNPVPGLGRARI